MIKCFIAAIVISSLVFLIIDVIWLSLSAKSFYRPHIGHLMLDKPILWAAAMFYILYVAGISIVVIQPCLEASFSKTFFIGFVFGLVAYGTYNLTNMAVLKDWSPTVVFVDMFWGGILTAFSSTTGILVAKKIFNI